MSDDEIDNEQNNSNDQMDDNLNEQTKDAETMLKDFILPRIVFDQMDVEQFRSFFPPKFQ